MHAWHTFLHVSGTISEACTSVCIIWPAGMKLCWRRWRFSNTSNCWMWWSRNVDTEINHWCFLLKLKERYQAPGGPSDNSLVTWVGGLTFLFLLYLRTGVIFVCSLNDSWCVNLFTSMGKPKKRTRSGTVDSSKLPISVKKNVHKYKRVRTKAVLKVIKIIKLSNKCFISANFVYSMYQIKS